MSIENLRGATIQVINAKGSQLLRLITEVQAEVSHDELNTPEPKEDFITDLWDVWLPHFRQRGDVYTSTRTHHLEFIDVVPADFLCESCCLVAREPSLTVCCGKHYCHTCISHLLVDSKPCPGCEAVPFNAILDKNYQRKVLALRVHCTMKDRGCQWSGQLEQLEAHLDVETGDCEYVDIECPEKCGQQIQKHQLAAHLKTCHSQVII